MRAGCSSFATKSPMTSPAHPAALSANTRCATNDGERLLMRNLRASGTIRSDRPRPDRDRPIAARAAACECHGTMRLEVEEIFR